MASTKSSGTMDQDVMNLSTKNTKRKSTAVDESIDEGGHISPSKTKLRVTDTNVRNLCDRSCDTQFVLISGLDRRLTTYNPLVVHRNLVSLIGNYATLKPLRSGTC